MKEERESDAKYKKLSIQRKTSEKVDREIYGAIQDRRNSVEEYSEVKVADLNENSSSGKYKQSSKI